MGRPADPVGIAFFFRNSQLDRTVAFYPSPARATESELALGAWEWYGRYYYTYSTDTTSW